jgi:hypothetical protein
MKRILPFLLIGIVATVGLFSCKKKVDNTININNNYFPIEIGRYVTYRVDSTIWSSFDCANNPMRESHRYMMYTIADTFRDNEDRLSYRIDVRSKNEDSMQWKPFKVVYASLNPASIEVTESNYRFIKMVFPVKDGITWKGNTYIPKEDADNMDYTNWSYLYSKTGEPYFNGYVNFDKTVTIDHVNNGINYNDADTAASYADRTFSQEVYGYNIGMVYREITHWQRQIGSCRDGYTVTMRAIDHN